MENHWQRIESAPEDRDLELAVIEKNVPHTLVFPCRRECGGWRHADTGAVIRVTPTHWRYWEPPA